MELLHAGATPRRALRYRIDRQLKKELVVGTDMAVRLLLENKPVTDYSYRYQLRVALAGRRPSSGPALQFQYKVVQSKLAGFKGDDGVAKQIRAKLRRHTAAAVNRTLLVSVTPLGKVSITNVPGGTLPREMLASSAQILQSYVLRLPTEPVGVGARWRVVDRVKTSTGARVTSRITCRLDAAGPQGIEISYNLQQLAVAQDIQPTGDTPRRLLSFVTRGTGTAQLSLSEPFSKLTFSHKMIARIRMGRPPGSQALRMEETVKLRLSPAP